MRTALLAFTITVTAVGSAAAATISVPAGGDLYAAILNAQAGDTIALAPGATYTGNFTLPVKSGTGVITIRPAGLDSLPAGRISPNSIGQLPKIQSPNSMPAIQTAPGAHNWKLMLLEITGSNDGDLVALGDGSSAQNSLAQVPHDLVIERCYIHGDATAGTKRCIALNSASTTIVGSYVSDCKWIGQDAQAIAGWNGPGPFAIIDNYLEGSAENVLFGGADPSIPNLVPSDIIISDNVISKPVAWRTQSWQVKNLVELKNARRVTIEGNIIENNWLAAQSGFGVLFTVRNQNGGCPWCQVAQVTFQNNVLQHSAAGISILGTDDTNPSQQTNGITIRNNLLADIDSQNWGGNGYAFMLTGGPRDVLIDHNTIIQNTAYGILTVDGAPIVNFTYTNNLARQNEYGIIGQNHGPGNDTIATYFPGSTITGNVIADASASQYPAGNQFPTSDQFRAQFVDYANGNYQLVPTSTWLKSATDGLNLGALLIGTVGAVPRLGRPRSPIIQPWKRSG